MMWLWTHKNRAIVLSGGLALLSRPLKRIAPLASLPQRDRHLRASDHAPNALLVADESVSSSEGR